MRDYHQSEDYMVTESVIHARYQTKNLVRHPSNWKSYLKVLDNALGYWF